MRAVLQRVVNARVVVGDEVVGAIDSGLLVYVGVGPEDGPNEVAWIARKIAELRLFPAGTSEGARSMERSLEESGGAVLLVSQFTLMADTRRGRRPAFTSAAAPEVAAPLIDALADALRTRGLEVATGRFGAHMRVESLNDGPVTILLGSGE